MKNWKASLLVGMVFIAVVPAHADTPVPQANHNGAFGAPIAADIAATPLSAAVGAYTAQSDEQAISGRVGQVCQKQGCWMTLTDGDVMARVMTDHQFALPKDLSGNVVVVGKLEAFDLDEKELAHMAKDAGKPLADVAPREYRIAARGVALR